MSDYFYVVKLARIAAAARTLRHAQKTMPGDDLGQKAVAACIIEMDAAIKILDETEGLPRFDANASLEELLRKS
jgi:hypothetical protein